MSQVTVATVNIFWFGLKKELASAQGLDIGFFHADADDVRLATMLSRLDADLLCFQEIVDVPRFEAVLAKVNPALRVRDATGGFVTSRAVSPAADTRQRVLLAWNEEKFLLLDWGRLPMWTRSPLDAQFEHVGSGRRVRVVGAHAKSSAPESTDQAGLVKRKEFASLATWVSDETAAGRLGEALILGDLNAMQGREDAKHLRQGALAAWDWREASGDPNSLWTTTTDRVVIDHVLVSPALAPRVTRWPEIVYFDRDPAVPDGPAGPPVHPEMLKRLTDHRPVRMKLDLGG